MSGTGVSISITSVTDAVAFILGTTSQLPALSTFCGFAAIGICADFLLQASGAHPAASWRFSARPPPPRAPSRRSSAPKTCLGWQISFFAGFMALDARREKRRTTDCCPCCCQAPIAEEIGYGCCCCPCTHASKQVKDDFLKQLIVKFYIPALRPMPVKVCVLLLFTVLSGVMAWSASNLKQDFKFRWFVASDATLQEAFDVQVGSPRPPPLPPAAPRPPLPAAPDARHAPPPTYRPWHMARTTTLRPPACR